MGAHTVRIEWYGREDLDEAAAAQIEPVDVVLDIGPGLRPQPFLRPRVLMLCEPHGEYVDALSAWYAGQGGVVIVHSTGQQLLAMMADRTVDSVFLIDVLEHVEKDAGRRLLEECQRVARCQLVVFTPLGYLPQDGAHEGVDAWGYHGGEWQAHRSGWMPTDFGPDWRVLACQDYHQLPVSGGGRAEPFGAFWAINDLVRKKIGLKVAFVSNVVPPMPSGQSSALARLLEGISGDEYCLVSARLPAKSSHETSFRGRLITRDSVLPGQYYGLPSVSPSLARGSFGRRIVEAFSLVVRTIQRARAISRICRRETVTVIVVCSGDLYDIPGAFLASRWLGLSCVVYLFDDYVYQWQDAMHRWFAQAIFRVVSGRAAAIVVPNEFMKHSLQQRYGVVATVVHNPGPAFGPSPGHVQRMRMDVARQRCRCRIVYTGAIYHAHFDSIRRLIAAMERLTDLQCELHLYTEQSASWLEEHGVVGAAVHRHEHVAVEQAMAEQRNADVLFLPLAFESVIPEVIAMSAPGKLGEYLASGTPILVHAPPGSYLSWYFAEHECGLVVEQPIVEVLEVALRRLVEERELGAGLASRAQARATADFSQAVAQARLVEVIRGGE